MSIVKEKKENINDNQKNTPPKKKKKNTNQNVKTIEIKTVINIKTHGKKAKAKKKNEEKNNIHINKFVYPVIGIIVSLVVFASSSYAFWTSSKMQVEENVVSTSCIDVTLTSVNSNSFTINNSFPITTGQAIASGKYNYSFTVTNNCDTNQDYVIAIRNSDESSANNQISYNYVSASLDGVGMGKLSDMEVITNPDSENKEGRILGYGSLGSLSTNTHTIGVWVNEDADNSIQNKTFKTNVYVALGQYNDGTEIKYREQLALKMKEEASDSVINFNNHSLASNTNGIYITGNTQYGNDVYYYRGNVNNNIIFGGLCWKIVRTTDTGGVKLLYNGSVSNGQCLETGGSLGSYPYSDHVGDCASVGYMYGNVPSANYAQAHSNINDSDAKIVLDQWYENNISSTIYDNYVEDTVYCNNRNVEQNPVDGKTSLSGFTNITFGVSSGLFAQTVLASSYSLNLQPSYKCENTSGLVPNDNDSFTVSSNIGNGMLDYPVGLLTSDELVFAGLNNSSVSSDSKNKSTYLHSSAFFTTMSPSVCANTGSVSMVNYQSTYGRLAALSTSTYRLLRPVISLKPGILIKDGGDGTSTNPYVVDLD